MISLRFSNKIFIITVFMVAVSLPFSAGAYFSGDADVSGNSFTNGTLEITVDNSAHAVAITSSSNNSFSFNSSSLGSIAPQYKLIASPTTCSSSFYNGINVEVTQGGVVYSGALNALSATSSTAGLWSVAVTAGSLVAINGEQCSVDLTLQAWQQEFPLWNTGGFSDEVVMTLVITAGEAVGPQVTSNVVLNEIYAHPNNASSTPYNIEWVELYNGTANPVDVANWSIGELSASSTNQHEIVSACPTSDVSKFMEPLIGSSTVIPAGGLLAVKFCGSASYLNQGDPTSETVSLHTSTSSPAIDSYSYTKTVEGKSDARIPDGGSWVDPIPSPGVSNMSTVTEEDLITEGWSDEMIEDVLGAKTTKQEKITSDDSSVPEVVNPNEEKLPEVKEQGDENDVVIEDDNVEVPKEKEDAVGEEKKEEVPAEEKQSEEQPEEKAPPVIEVIIKEDHVETPADLPDTMEEAA